MQNTTGIDLSDAVLVDDYLATLEARVARAEKLLATNLAANMTSGATSEATPPVDLANAAANARAVRAMTPRQKTAWVQSRAREVGPEQTRQEMAAMAAASAEEYEQVLLRSGIDPTVRR